MVVYRRLGFALEQIQQLIDGGTDVGEHLRRQQAAVADRLEELRGLVVAIDRAIEKERTGMDLTRDEQRELFGDAFDESHAAEAARRQIAERFYDLTPAFHRNLGDMYVADPRFTRTYEDIRPGLAAYVRDAIHANADRAER